jgi:hypothetical protein
LYMFFVLWSVTQLDKLQGNYCYAVVAQW